MNLYGNDRLSILTIEISHPVLIQEFFTFSNTCELIEQWALIYKDTIKKFGYSGSANELKAAVLKTVKAEKATTPYIEGVLVNQPRFFNIGRLSPLRLEGVFSANQVIKNEFTKNLSCDPSNESMCNIDFLRLSFPETLMEVQNDINFSVNCLEDLD